MELSPFIAWMLTMTAFGFVHSRTVTHHEPKLCLCKGRPYYEEFEPYRYNECITCVHCGLVQHTLCRDECVNPEPEVEDDGVCCPVCPTGPNCEHKGVIIPHGDKVKIGNKLCECLPLVLGYDPTKSFCIDIPSILE